MIRTFKHRGLQKLYERGERRHVRADHANRIEDILGRLEVSSAASELNLPGYHFHTLRESLKGFFSVKVSGNWRIIYRFKDGDAFDVDLIDYH